MSAVQIKMWHRCFKYGQESVESDPCSGRPAKSRMPENVECVWTAINKGQRLTVQALEADLGIPETTVSKILMQDLGMKHVMAKFVQSFLLPEQKEHRAAVANDLIQTSTNEPDFHKKVITLKGAEASLSYVQCFLCLVSSSVLYFSYYMTEYFLDRPPYTSNDVYKVVS